MRVSDLNSLSLTSFGGFGSDLAEAPFSRLGPDRPPPQPTPVDVDLAAVVNAHIAAARSSAVDADARFDASWLIADTAAQLASFDDQLAQLRGSVQSNIVASNELGRKSEVLSLIQAALSNQNVGTDDAFALEKLTINLGGRSISASVALENVGLLEIVQPKEKLVDGNVVHKVTPRSIEQSIEAIRSEQSRRNSSNEMILLQLQQVMHQRSQCVEVTSQLLRNLQRTQDAIVQNLGR